MKTPEEVLKRFIQVAEGYGHDCRLRNDPHSSDMFFAYETEKLWVFWQGAHPLPPAPAVLTPEEEQRAVVDRFILLRARAKEIGDEAKELVKDLKNGRHEGTLKDVRVWMAGPSYSSCKGGRRVSVVDKLKPKAPAKPKK